MQYFHGEFARMAIDLSREQEWMLWCLCRANFFGGTLPKSPKRLAAICRMTPAEFKDNWPAIRRHFDGCKGGWQVPRYAELREKALRKKGAQSKGAHMTAEKKRQKREGPQPIGAAIVQWTERQKGPSHER
jgi:hypothetical protein